MASLALERLAEPGSASPEIALFEPLLGAWDVTWHRFGEDGEGETRRGEWHFSRVLGGYGVQDVIWVAGTPPEEAGTTLRCWDGERGIWRAVFMSPADGEFVALEARPAPDGIRQLVVDPVEPGRRREWNFSRIEAGSFLWQEVETPDGGERLRVTHEIRARRREV